MNHLQKVLYWMFCVCAIAMGISACGGESLDTKGDITEQGCPNLAGRYYISSNYKVSSPEPHPEDPITAIHYRISFSEGLDPTLFIVSPEINGWTSMECDAGLISFTHSGAIGTMRSDDNYESIVFTTEKNGQTSEDIYRLSTQTNCNSVQGKSFAENGDPRANESSLFFSFDPEDYTVVFGSNGTVMTGYYDCYDSAIHVHRGENDLDPLRLSVQAGELVVPSGEAEIRLVETP